MVLMLIEGRHVKLEQLAIICPSGDARWSPLENEPGGHETDSHHDGDTGPPRQPRNAPPQPRRLGEEGAMTVEGL